MMSSEKKCYFCKQNSHVKDCLFIMNRYRLFMELTVRVAAVAVLLLLGLSSCHHQKAGCHGDGERYARQDSLLATVTDADSLAALVAKSHKQNDAITEMLALKYHGNVLRKLTRFDEAIQAHDKGLEVATKAADTIEMAQALYNLGMDYRRRGDMSYANGYYYKSLKLIEAYSGRDDDEALRVRIKALNGIGNIEFELHNYVIADSVLREALEGELRFGDNVDLAVNYGSLGRIKHAIGENDSAWVYFRKSMEYNQLANNRVGMAMCHMHFGELHSDERRFSHAKEEYKEAYDLLKVEDDIWFRMEVCLSLANVDILLGEESDARKYLQEVEVEAQRMGSKEHLARAHEIHYELALLEGDSHGALQHYTQSKDMYDSIYGMEFFDEIHTQRMDYERNRTSGEIDVLNRDISHLKRMRNIQRVLLILLVLMAGAIIAALTYAVRVRTRTQRLMRQVEETRSLFFTNVVHQLRTPLTAIMGAIDGILTEERQDVSHKAYSQSQQENAELIERQGKNLLVLVDRILEVGGVRSAIKALEWRHGDVVTLIRMVIESYRERCVEKHIELTFAPCKSSLEVDTVPRYLITIVGNLVENAINYSNEMDRITITACVEKGMLVIRVADTGMGISKDDLPHVFEPFYRAAAAEQLMEGMGIGLTVVRDMAMAMGGVVAADSMKDSGSVFTVKLPCKHSSTGLTSRFDEKMVEAETVTMMQRPRLGMKPAEDGNGETAPDAPLVLIVEDHSDVARLVGLVLGNDYQVAYATDGEQGYAKACDLQPDLIITDVKMPLMDGLELCRKLKQTRRLCHIPVIVLSARNSESDRIHGVEAGADAYLVKPFVPEEMRAWVKHLLESRRMLRDVYTSLEETPAPSSRLVDADVDMEDQEFLDRFAIEVYRQSAGGIKLDYDSIARSLKMGESQMRNKIQALTGKSVPAYVTSLRMDKAIRLLRSDNNMLVGDIAEQCGFQDVAYFSRVFRHHFGMTPT